MKSQYRTKIFYNWMNNVLSDPKIGDLRRQLLTHVRGKTLEIGFGTGLNLPYYPQKMESLIVIDPVMASIVKVADKPAYDFQQMEAENLLFQDSTFDTVVSTFTLCSVKSIDLTLREIQRVLKPDGRFLFLEHGKSWIKPLSIIQNIVNPIYNTLAVGCNVNREMEQSLSNNKFQLEQIQHIRFGRQPISGFFYLGVATKKENKTGEKSP